MRRNILLHILLLAAVVLPLAGAGIAADPLLPQSAGRLPQSAGVEPAAADAPGLRWPAVAPAAASETALGAGNPLESALQAGFPLDGPGQNDRLGQRSGVAAQQPRSAAGPRPLGFGGGGGQGSAAAGSLANLMTAGDMIGFSRDLGDGVQAITIINASKRWMAVYHIDSGGQIRLTSSRPLDADFTIQFNASSPLPEEIRRLQGK